MNASCRVKDQDGKTWVVVHTRRAHYDIKKRCSPKSFAGGWNRLGEVIRYCEPRGDGLRWKDLAGNESEEVFPTIKACLLAFVDEMARRHEDNIRRREGKEGK